MKTLLVDGGIVTALCTASLLFVTAAPWSGPGPSAQLAAPATGGGQLTQSNTHAKQLHHGVQALNGSLQYLQDRLIHKDGTWTSEDLRDAELFYQAYLEIVDECIWMHEEFLERSALEYRGAFNQFEREISAQIRTVEDNMKLLIGRSGAAEEMQYKMETLGQLRTMQRALKRARLRLDDQVMWAEEKLEEHLKIRRMTVLEELAKLRTAIKMDRTLNQINTHFESLSSELPPMIPVQLTNILSES